MEETMEPIKDASHLYEVERRARYAERPGFRICELQIWTRQQVPWHCHSNIQDTFYIIEGEVRLFLRTEGGGASRPLRYLFRPTSPSAPDHEWRE